MSKRNNKGQYARGKAPAVIIGSWLVSFLSLGLVYVAGAMVDSDFAGFRHCSANTSGLSISTCGKQSLNLTDLALLGLLLLTIACTVSLFTAAWRMTRRTSIL